MLTIGDKTQVVSGNLLYTHYGDKLAIGCTDRGEELPFVCQLAEVVRDLSLNEANCIRALDCE